MKDKETFDKFDKLRVELNDKLKVIYDLGGGHAFKENDLSEDLVKLTELITDTISAADVLIEDLLRIKVEPEQEVKAEEITNVSTENTGIIGGEIVIEEVVSLSTENTIHAKEASDDLSTEQTIKRSTDMFKYEAFSDDARPYRCVICDKPFKAEKYVKRHLKEKHPSEVRDVFKRRRSRPGTKLLHKCRFCNKSFVSLTYFRDHERIHTGEKVHTCDMCPKSFTLNATLRRHIELIHNGERERCDICKKTFSKSTIGLHKRIHMEERLFSCDICGKGFTQKCILDSHLRTHTGERPYKCEDCGHSSTTKSNLTTHIKRMHKKEKPYACELCEKSFLMKGSLEDHLRVHTGEKPYSCEECDQSFATKHGLSRHCRKYHKVKRVKENQVISLDCLESNVAVMEILNV